MKLCVLMFRSQSANRVDELYVLQRKATKKTRSSASRHWKWCSRGTKKRGRRKTH